MCVGRTRALATGAAAAVSAYVVLGGQYVTITSVEDDDEVEEEEVDEDED